MIIFANYMNELSPSYKLYNIVLNNNYNKNMYNDLK